MNVTRKQVYQQLEQVIDPELEIDIVSLGLIYEVTIHEDLIHVIMTLTSPGCPLAGVIDAQIKSALTELESVGAGQVSLEVTFDPPWNIEMMSPEARAELGFD